MEEQNGVEYENTLKHHSGDITDSEPVISPPDADDIPNGGLVAWQQVLGSFLLLFNSWGIINTIGAFQTYYELHLDASASQISWIGSVQAFLLQIVGLIAGPAFDAGYFRQLIFLGSFCSVFGMMMTSLCKEYWQFMLAQGIFVGVGVGCTFVPSVAIVSTYFSSRKSLATGIATAGSSLAGIIFPIMFQQLQPRIGFAWTTRIIAFFMLATLSTPMAVMKQRVLPAQKRKLYDSNAFREPPFVLFTLGAFLGFMGLYVPFFYTPSFTLSLKGVDSSISIYTITIICAASTFGRILPNFIADKTGPLNMLIPCVVLSSIIAYAWIVVKDLGGLITFCIFYGFCSGCLVSLPPTVIVGLSPNIGVAGTRMGMAFGAVGLGLLVGNPVAGALLGLDNDFLKLQIFCGATIAVSGVFFCCSRVYKTGFSVLARI